VVLAGQAGFSGRNRHVTVIHSRRCFRLRRCVHLPLRSGGEPDFQEFEREVRFQVVPQPDGRARHNIHVEEFLGTAVIIDIGVGCDSFFQRYIRVSRNHCIGADIGVIGGILPVRV
jgi:hypothetical protein